MVRTVRRFRDVQKLYAAMTDGKAEYVLYGVENQEEIHYAMAVKNYLYDALEYAGQVEEASRSRRKALQTAREQEGGIVPKTKQGTDAHPAKRPNAGEFLGGFWKEDRLIPSVTVTIYFGSDEWDGPLSLFDMMETKDKKVLSCMDDYHVRLIALALMTDEEIMKFQSSLREVMLFIKHSKDKEALKKILDGNRARFQSMERRAMEVINVITGTELEYEESEEKVNVCEAIRDMRLESEQIGELRKARESAERLYKMGIAVEKVAEGLDYDVATVMEWLNLPA